MSEEERSFRVEGLVQGVGFRLWTVDVARRLGMRGWVCNRGDGTVEVHAAGAAGQLELLEEKLGQGPRAARVERVRTSHGAARLPSQGFEVRVGEDRDEARGEV
jgi:acylphosphatase